MTHNRGEFLFSIVASITERVSLHHHAGFTIRKVWWSQQSYQSEPIPSLRHLNNVVFGLADSQTRHGGRSHLKMHRSRVNRETSLIGQDNGCFWVVNTLLHICQMYTYFSRQGCGWWLLLLYFWVWLLYAKLFLLAPPCLRVQLFWAEDGTVAFWSVFLTAWGGPKVDTHSKTIL